MVPGIIGLSLIWTDWRIRAPFAVFTVLRGLNLVLWKVLPYMRFWTDFTAWSAALGGYAPLR